MKVEVNERTKEELIYIQDYFFRKTGQMKTLSNYANVAINEFYNRIRIKEIDNGTEATKEQARQY